MTQKNDGGPAFPGFDPDSKAPKPTNGMSLRDYAAIKYGCAIISNPTALQKVDDMATGFGMKATDLLVLTGLAYADAFIRAREGGDT